MIFLISEWLMSHGVFINFVLFEDHHAVCNGVTTSKLPHKVVSFLLPVSLRVSDSLELRENLISIITTSNPLLSNSRLTLKFEFYML
jgi:hypothetical protein